MDLGTFWVILATAAVTNGVGIGTLWANHHFQRDREDRAREAEEDRQVRAERRSFQRETLIRVQEILVELAHSSVRPDSLDGATYGYGARSFSDVVGEGWSDKLATLAGELEMLRVRLTDDDLRKRLRSIRSDVIFVIDVADNQIDGGEGLMGLNKKCLETLDRVGQFLTAEWAP
ncbi:hypothetical protein [Nitriliruptor alkaliphilus]|uniref:hypothetical protein n=1 Tax=Nitriliruptor alkaliphilus TaxID=427918 RepID=UPI0006989252|nr:hypothetical protein [Nitriliruptor alkaliphilus]